MSNARLKELSILNQEIQSRQLTTSNRLPLQRRQFLQDVRRNNRNRVPNHRIALHNRSHNVLYRQAIAKGSNSMPHLLQTVKSNHSKTSGSRTAIRSHSINRNSMLHLLQTAKSNLSNPSSLRTAIHNHSSNHNNMPHLR